MIRTVNIRSLSDFRQHAIAHLDRLASDGGAEVLTVQGEAKGVVMSPAEFGRLAELVRQAEITKGIFRSRAQFAAGEGVSHPDGMMQLAEELGIELGPRT